ncbi:MAG: hypothetical protein H6624_16395 [Bdellovibrionaceae bacterium]|nr:hypothetical protein [Bdellovibrionales bacterium]MCB9085927.1 hypothetical protein [Pseudobdellovibrionaceae bacterium]
MKSLVLVLAIAICTLSVIEQAQARGGDGSAIIELTRELQRCYAENAELQVAVSRCDSTPTPPPAVEVWTCKLVRNSFGTTYYGDTRRTEGEARRSAYDKCVRSESFESSCSERESKTTCTRDYR